MILNHCLGVMAYWGTQVVTDQDVHRDRPAEFTSSGKVSDLTARAQIAKQQLRACFSAVDLHEPARQQQDRGYGANPEFFTNGASVAHILEELAQHHGQMEITRDILMREHTPD